MTADNAAVLDVISGVFGPYDSTSGHDVVAFYWHMARPVMQNLCASHVCRLEGVELQYGSVHPLRHENNIQAGHFKLVISSSGAGELAEQAFYHLIYPDGSWDKANKLPEVEDILPNGGSYINDLHYFNEVVLAQDKSDDILKTLEVEYKRFLIWQELDGGHYQRMNHQENHIIKKDCRFDRIREQIKDKTLSECIVDRTFLMEKVWAELETGELPDDLFAEEEKIDILKTLSPEHIVAKGKYKVPELVFQDFYKVGLDSYY
ncbi:TagK domain-containing protein [Dryocola boscaweniae]|uniref:TagK domain-containing protein n=1 Tax=Dryocola boscaweniae TaxID=2925397 RepID=UPI0022F05870|nr:TagK domain-containing protein [Dryocola boscaweniae]